MYKKRAEFTNIEWRNGQPFSCKFQDVYFSTDNGLLESEYVFLQGNALNTRWIDPEIQAFTIAETGFGTGLNFLCALNLWLVIAPQNAILHFISVEKHPLNLQDISAALAMWTKLKTVSETFLDQYNRLINGSETVHLYNGRVKLTLLIGDATERLSQINYKIDAWFLDGFAPSKNPDMWQTDLFKQMVRLSKSDATFATFTSAGNVRRGLMSVGFKVTKRSGFGKKREMLIGSLESNDHET